MEQEATGEWRASKKGTLREPLGTQSQVPMSSALWQCLHLTTDRRHFSLGLSGEVLQKSFAVTVDKLKIEPGEAGWSEKVVETPLGLDSPVARDDFDCGVPRGKPCAA